MIYDPPMSVLLYGGPGVGKSATALLAFWDWKKKVQTANGRWITFGRENNPALNVPPELRVVGSGDNALSLRFAQPSLDSFDWLDRFEDVVDGLLLEAEKGNCLDALVVDGMSEFDLLFESCFQQVKGGADKWDKWDELLNRMFAAMTRLDHEALNCVIIVTARVMEKKKSKQSGTSRIAGDPNFIDFDYYPSLRGSFRLHFPHYFNLVSYMETRLMLVTDGEFIGQRLPAHVMNMVRTGEFYVKNQWEYDWMIAGEELEIINPSFPDVHRRLVQVASRGSATKEIEGQLVTEVLGGVS